jgi:hypothetical protein
MCLSSKLYNFTFEMFFFSRTGDMLASRCIMVNDRDVTVYTGPSDMVRNFNWHSNLSDVVRKDEKLLFTKTCFDILTNISDIVRKDEKL